MSPGSHRLAGWTVLLAALLSGLAGTASGGDKPPSDVSRIVSIGGDVTEILYALKAAPKVVAVDTTSTYPESALKEKTSIGYMRALSAEGVLSTNPSVIIAAEHAGPPEVVAVLKSSSVPYVEVPDDASPEGVIAKIRLIAATIGAKSEADELVRKVTHDFDVLAAHRSRISKPLRALFVLTVQNGRAIVGGRGTAADAVFGLAGAENAAAGVNGFKPIADEAAVELAPDVIVTMASRGPDHDAQKLLKLPAFRATPAAVNDRLIEMDGNYLLSFGPRAGRAARDLMHILYPELARSTGKGQ